MRATTVGQGPFKPAIQHEGVTYVLGTTNSPDEDEAQAYAQILVDEWNELILNRLREHGFVRTETL